MPSRCVTWNIRRIPDDYKKRRGMEGGYPGVERLIARTTSRNQAARLLYFYHAAII